MRIPSFISFAGLALACLTPLAARAQTDFYGLDKYRPLRVEDAFSAKRHAFEFQFAPLGLAQGRAGDLAYTPSVELKHGLVPGLEVSAGWGYDVVRADGRTRTGVSEVDVSALLNLWVEGRRLPAAGLRVSGHLPARDGQHSSVEVKGLLTRSLGGPVRLHVNGAAVFGDEAHDDAWLGLAVDWVLPFHHTLLLAETWANQPSDEALDRTVHSSVGVRYQATPTLVIDAGLGRSWTGPVSAEEWTLTVGLSREFGVRGLMPGERR